MRFARAIVAVAFALPTSLCFAAEELITTAHYKSGEVVPYILNHHKLPPRYVIILFPGGTGVMNPHMENDKLVYGFKGNFVIRTRKLMVDDEFATVATDSTQAKERIQAVLDDIKDRFPEARIYLMGTSNGTFDTMSLAGYLSDKITGEIHTSSLQRIASFDTRKFKNRHLIVHHKQDHCRATPFGAAQSAHEKYGTELIAMEGGIEVGDPCEPRGHHGFNGIERETIEAIKSWVKKVQ